jgi:DNA (cytosine-5)-methyltransferase 1
MKHLFNYKWYLKDGYPAPNITKNNYNVFGTFVCGGGSTMGYKLAGFNHLGGVEIDKRIADVYKENHKPKYFYNADIRDFNKLNDLPNELYNLDLLDGSPPCSSFSMAGNREKDWGKSKQFKEGQKLQVLDDLVFVYCETILKLKPKVFLLENVKGLIQGNAKLYVKQIVNKLSKDYNVQIFLLNSASMGVPQKRERVFFIGHKKEFNLPKLKLEFNEPNITFDKISEIDAKVTPELRDSIKDYYDILQEGENVAKYHPKGNHFGAVKINYNKVCPTILADTGGSLLIHPKEKRYLSNKEYMQIGTYPLDYNFKEIKPKYLIGMSVPPVMTAQIANQIKIQWLQKL